MVFQPFQTCLTSLARSRWFTKVKKAASEQDSCGMVCFLCCVRGSPARVSGGYGQVNNMAKSEQNIFE